MKDLKIKVNTESESKQAKSLLESLGFDIDFSEKGFKYPYLFAYVNGMHVTGDNREGRFKNKNNKEITLPELRDLVVLKRNDVGDKTHDGVRCGSYYVTSDNTIYFYDSYWVKLACASNVEYIKNHLKPIEKPMKEYLRKNSNGTYSYIGTVRPEYVSDFMIEIPEGATYYAKDANLGKSGNFFFRLRSDGFDFEAVWLESNWMQASFNVKNQEVLWQRHTHPEELPFIDDEPSLNDQYAEIEKVRQSHRTASETSNPTIKETLNQRQEQYGSFEDVAMITEQMVDVMRKGYYENLAYNQKMALYMICSKMARIVNGNPNHKDSWHDIAGYATLIDNELESEKDMPF